MANCPQLGAPGGDDDSQDDQGPSDWDAFFAKNVGRNVEHAAGLELARKLVATENQRNSLRTALYESIAMLRSAAVWPADDIAGLRYHVYETANRADAVIASVEESEGRS